MACFKPIHGFRAPGGTIKMSRSGAYRDRPVTVSCGQCTGCRLERSRQWAVRCVHESQMHDRNSFITLTYEDKHLPPLGSLDVDHWKRFAKRLRKKMGPFRFFHCGEYGDQTNRPHYHAAIFGLDFFKDRELLKFTPTGDKLYTSKILTQTWGHGEVVIGELTFSSAAYVARYIMKKITGDQADKHYDVMSIKHEGLILGTRKPEYVTMSRRPGVGSKWIEKYLDEVYPSDEVIMNGKPGQPPKFYDSICKLNSPTLFEQVRKIRAIKAQKQLEENTPDRLDVRETCQNAKMNLYQRKL